MRITRFSCVNGTVRSWSLYRNLPPDLNDVTYVPIQAVGPSEGKQVCYVVHGLKSEQREVEIGQFNDDFLEIKKGLKEGEKVLLRAPESGEPETGKKKPGSDNKGKPRPAEKSAPPNAQPPGKA